MVNLITARDVDLALKHFHESDEKKRKSIFNQISYVISSQEIQHWEE